MISSFATAPLVQHSLRWVGTRGRCHV